MFIGNTCEKSLAQTRSFSCCAVKTAKGMLTVAFLFIATGLVAQTKKHHKPVPATARTGCVMLKGNISFNDLLYAPSYYWMKTGADHYVPDEAAIKDMERTMWRYSVVVFMGTWDTGSQNLVPKLYKVMDEAAMLQNVTLYAADVNRSTGKSVEEKYFVSTEPTIIVFDGDREVGRITNRVKVSVEYDLADMALKYLDRKHVEDVEKTAAMPYFSVASVKEDGDFRSLVR